MTPAGGAADRNRTLVWSRVEDADDAEPVQPDCGAGVPRQAF